MTDLTDDKVRELLGFLDLTDGRQKTFPNSYVEDLARALLSARADAEAAVALALQEACEVLDTSGDSAVTEALGQRLCCSGHHCGCQGADVGSFLQHLIRALAPASGVAKLAELRAELTEWRENYHAVSQSRAALRAEWDEWKRLAVAGEITARHMNILEAELAAANAREAGLLDAVRAGFAFAAPGEWLVVDIRRVVAAIEAALKSKGDA